MGSTETTSSTWVNVGQMIVTSVMKQKQTVHAVGNDICKPVELPPELPVKVVGRTGWIYLT